MPSTRYGPHSPIFPVSLYTFPIEPIGSAPITFIFGFFSFKYFAVPVIVPAVPSPATKCVIFPSVASQISGPVVL